MFGQFITFIVVLLIYTTYQPTGAMLLSARGSAGLAALIIGVFGIAARSAFHRIAAGIRDADPVFHEQSFHRCLHQYTLFAIALFAAEMHLLGLPDHLAGVRILEALPTLKASLFLGLFLFHLCLLYAAAYPAYRHLFQSRQTRAAYVWSQIAFAAPVLMPWLLLSGVEDLINILPLEAPRKLLATTEGQVGYFLIFLLGTAVFAPLLIRRFWGCHSMGDDPARWRIEALCRRAGLGYADILYWPIFEGRMITAGVMGLVGRFRYILVTRALIDMLHPVEVDAVIAHEIGHVKRFHIPFYLAFFIGYMLLSLTVVDSVLYGIIATGPVSRFLLDSGVDTGYLFPTVFAVGNIGSFLLYFRYIFGYFMRNFERQADGYVYTLFDSARPLIATFEKIALTSGQSPEKPNWHHFSIAERIRHLLRCEGNPAWITRHDRKVRWSIATYLVLVILAGATGLWFHSEDTIVTAQSDLLEIALRRELERKPEDAELWLLLGILRYERKQPFEAAAAYDRAVALAPDMPTGLNSLAWLLATSPMEELHDPERALRLARRAVELQPESFVFDTLAECLFANGLREEAVAAAREAIKKADPKDRPLYETQLKKFQTAALPGTPPPN